jgi:glycosyltransferase involved in cell wall biosynthesis
MTRPARIGIDSSAMLIAHKHGYENYVEALLLNMVELGSELEGLELVFYFHAGNPLADPGQLAGILPRFEGFRCRVYRHRHLFGRLLPLMAWADRLDWLHLPVYLWSRWYPCRVGVTFHDACGARLALEEAGRVLEKHEGRVREQLATACRYIAVSESTRRDMVDIYGVDPGAIHVVHHGADPFFHPSAEDALAAKRRYGLSRYILNVNALQTHKNHERLLAAFARLRQEAAIDHQLVLVGRDGLGAERIHATLAASELSDAVRHLGYVSRRELRGLYSGAELVVNPSLCEGFGLPVLEAMGCGAVIAASNTTSLPEVGADATLYFDPLDERAIARKILQGLTDADLRTELRTKGLLRARQFSWRKAALDTIQVYRVWSSSGRRHSSQ